MTLYTQRIQTTIRRAGMAQENQNGEHDRSAVRVAVWYDYI